MTRSLRPVVLGFIDTAPVAHTLHLELAASTEQVYAMLSDSPATWTWMPSVKGGRWLGTLSEVPATSTRPTSTKAEYTFYIDPLRFTGPAARAMGFGLSRVAAKAETNLNRIFASQKN